MQKIEYAVACVAYTLIYIYSWFPTRTEIIESLRFSSPSNGKLPSCNKAAPVLSATSITSILLSATIRAIVLACVIQIVLYGCSIISENALAVDLKCYPDDAGASVLKPMFYTVYKSLNLECEPADTAGFPSNLLGSALPIPAGLDALPVNAIKQAQGVIGDSIGTSLKGGPGGMQLPDMGSNPQGLTMKGGGRSKSKNKKPKESMETKLRNAFSQSVISPSSEDVGTSDVFENAGQIYTAVAYNVQFALLALAACATFTYAYEKSVLPFISCDYEMMVVQANIICVINLCIYLGVMFYVFIRS